MAPKVAIAGVPTLAGLLLLLSLVPPAEAYDAGDALALLLCSVLAGVGFCAFLGWYARRRNGQM
ncbi:unnamed protein product [Ophioblennius macclurei]